MADPDDTLVATGTFPALEQLQSASPGLALEQARRAIQAREPRVRAWAYLPADAAACPAEPLEGPLAGIPFGVKDVIDVAGMPTGCGSPASAAAAAPFNAASVELLLRAGAVPVGKTVTAEYAFRDPGPTRNPANLAHTPGGSSSGSAAAVAAGMVPFALSTQTGGSIIRPAAYCGVPGYKPSFGLLSRDGLKLTSESLDVIGWHGASVDWVLACARALLPDTGAPRDATLAGAKVAVIDFSAEAAASADVLAVLRDTAATLERLGAQCVAVDAKQPLTLLARAHAVIMKYEFARNLAPVVRARRQALSDSLLENVRQGWQVPHAEYLEMRALQRELRASWHAFTGGADFILTPSAADDAPAGHAFTGAPVFNKCWSVLGWPCLHLPVRPSPRGLPVGVQLVGQFEQDFPLLAYGRQLEQQLSIEGAKRENSAA
ncbi:amidase [Bordetella petrii]|nr:amidase [Bordetella petrii]